MKRFILTCFTVIALCTSSYAQISTESYVTADDVTIAQMESNRLTLTNAINSADGALLTSLSVTSAKLDANANPENRWDEVFSDFVFTGLLPPTSASLSTITTSGTAYIEGVRVIKDATSKSYTADRYTFVDLSKTGVYTYSEITFDGTEPSTALNSVRLARVSTDTTTVLNVRDDRDTTLTSIAQTSSSDGTAFAGSTSGTTTVTASAVATGTLTLPAETGTIISTGTVTKIGEISVNQANASADVSYTGIGFKPRVLIFFANDSGTSETSWGFDNGSNQGCVIDARGDTVDTYTSSSTYSIFSTDASGDYAGVVKSLDADGFTITWTKTSSPTGVLTIEYLAIP